MSLINVFLSPSKVLIGVDTESGNAQSGQFTSTSKLVHFPHLNAVMAVRGNHAFLLFLFAMVSQIDLESQSPVNFDLFLKAVPKKFNMAYEILQTKRVPGIDPTLFESQEVVFAGWSDEKARMHAVCFSKYKLDGDLSIVEIEEPGYMLPWEDHWGEAPEGTTRQAMAHLALEQTRNVKRENPAIAIGGRLILAELTRHQMTIDSVCELTEEANNRFQPIAFTAEEMRRINSGNAEAKLVERVSEVRVLAATN